MNYSCTFLEHRSMYESISDDTLQYNVEWMEAPLSLKKEGDPSKFTFSRSTRWRERGREALGRDTKGRKCSRKGKKNGSNNEGRDN